MENNENESYEEAYTKFNLTLIYNNTNITVKVNNNKPIVSIREIAYNIFYPINGKIQLIYRNKDIKAKDNKRKMQIALLSTGALVIGFVLIRFLLFGLHGMKQWPLILMLLCLAVIIISIAIKAKITS